MKNITFGQDVLLRSLQRRWTLSTVRHVEQSLAAARILSKSVTFEGDRQKIVWWKARKSDILWEPSNRAVGHDKLITKRTSFTHHFLCHRIPAAFTLYSLFNSVSFPTVKQCKHMKLMLFIPPPINNYIPVAKHNILLMRVSVCLPLTYFHAVFVSLGDGGTDGMRVLRKCQVTKKQHPHNWSQFSAHTLSQALSASITTMALAGWEYPVLTGCYETNLWLLAINAAVGAAGHHLPSSTSKHLTPQQTFLSKLTISFSQ